MAITNALVLRQALAQVPETVIGTGGRLSIYSGTVPTNADTALGAQVLVARTNVSTVNSGNFMGDPNGSGVASLAAAMTLTATPAGTSTPSFFRWETGAGACVQQGTCGIDGSGADMILAAATVVQNQNINLTGFTQTGI